MADEPVTPEYAALPFQEAVEFFRQKVNVPSAKWADVLGGAHARAFTVAGATKEGMLADFRTAIDSAIADGTTLDTFRKGFDDIVQRYGWDYKGGRAWRTRTIFETNLSTAYAAGRYAQMTDPDVVRLNPYWRYRHSDNVKHPRPEHLAWDGLVLRHDDPWWSTHMPPNGWGCQCSAEPLSERELKALGKNGPDRAPASDMRPATLNTSAGPVTIQVPKGVDPGWGYSVGEAASGKKLAELQMDAWRAEGEAAWESLTPGDWASAGRPKALPVDEAAASPASAPVGLQAAIERAIGGSTAALPLPTGDTVQIDAAALAAHLPAGQARFVPLLPELLRDPAEIWLRFERHKGTGKVVLRQRLIKLLRFADRQTVAMVLQASGGSLDTWTVLHDLDQLQAQRAGHLLWARP
ncbi:MAG TPA: PBECR2 nuclease fold domain-containing protein [Aliidongia sp.]|nr:PBECR2 nuclease fold domain-containing protein [Aliidongia sp.]